MLHSNPFEKKRQNWRAIQSGYARFLSYSHNVKRQQSETVAPTPKRFVYSETESEDAVHKSNILMPKFPFDIKRQSSLLQEVLKYGSLIRAIVILMSF